MGKMKSVRGVQQALAANQERPLTSPIHKGMRPLQPLRSAHLRKMAAPPAARRFLSRGRRVMVAAAERTRIDHIGANPNRRRLPKSTHHRQRTTCPLLAHLC
jgi:hypothetical protein